ncbi:YycH family regulatory protein [Natribacillus halophilus]|uniref:Two-component signal transduction system YycFG, regulatory protein YycH n=1 Tax=Natribacillus halophilus TaxID=549003 RepID=A0A1G8L0T1_9BACI|nr:two-component system activity regulator YycH [Natribacillus halophilus]SDI49266.1 Two-component signal transduction system YycFG, regulatory protein YycH [Natribacillus halophilus]
MIEQIKSVILSILIISSLILTWQVWTYQPDLEALEDESVEESEPLADQVEMNEVIAPVAMTFHRNNEPWMSTADDEDFIDEVMEDLLSSSWGDFEMLEDIDQEQIYEGQEDKIELILPTEIPLQLIDDFLEDDEVLLEEYEDTFTFERVLIAEEGENVRVQFVSFEEQQVLEGYVDMATVQFQEYMDHMDDSSVYYAVEEHVGDYDGPLQKPVYLPSESVTYPSLQYRSIDINEEMLLPYLFGDPESLLNAEEETVGEEELYYSSDRQMRVSSLGNFIEYDYPQNQTSANSDDDIIRSAYEFVNAHGGFTNSYQLYDWNVSGESEFAQFRMMVEGLPVLDTGSSPHDYASIDVVQENSEISGYDRPAFSFNDQEPYDENTEELPDGETVLAAVDENDHLQMSDIQDIRIGYDMERVDTFVEITPHWYARSDDSWYRLDADDREEEINGLE